MQQATVTTSAGARHEAPASTEVPELPEGTHTVEVVTADIAGILRGKRVPAAAWPSVVRSGVALADVVYEWSPLCEIAEASPYSTVPGGVPDIHLLPIVETLRPVPWRPGTARVMGQARQADGTPVPVDPRHALQRVLEKARSMGYEVQAALEVEFYLLDPETRRPVDETLQCYSIERAAQYERVLGAICDSLLKMGISVEACNTEYAPGQFEVNVRHDEALRAADAHVQFRNAVREIASQHGFLATFMAKPFTDMSGSGVHIHQSLWRDGENAFADEDGRLSDVGRAYLGGLLHHMQAGTIFGSPSANAFKRREDYSFCPTRVNWGGDNRLVALRVIEGSRNAVRIEQRDGSADCNPYLILAAQISAGLDGIERGLDPGEPVVGDANAEGTGELLARSVPEALEAMRNGELARIAFEPLMVEAYAAYCQAEHDATVKPVTDVERNRYLSVI